MEQARNTHQAEPSSERTQVYAHIFHGADWVKYKERFLEGKEPEESPYGFHRAAHEGFDIALSRDYPRNINGFLYRALKKIFKVDVLHAFSNRKAIAACDVVWTMTEDEAFAVGLLFALGIVKPRPIISNAVWLFNKWDGLSASRKLIYRVMGRHITRMTVNSAKCLDVAREAFPGIPVQVMFFGINTDTFTVTPPRSGYGQPPMRLVAIGQDHTRDWNTVVAAFGGDERFHLTIICSWVDQKIVDPFTNIEVIRKPSMRDFLNNYEKADMVVVPMKDNIFSGITVALEAVALGKSLMSTRTGGIPTYFEDDDVFYVEVEDPEDMRRTALGASPAERVSRSQRAQRTFLKRDYSTKALIKRYAELTRQVIDGDTHPDRAALSPITAHQD